MKLFRIPANVCMAALILPAFAQSPKSEPMIWGSPAKTELKGAIKGHSFRVVLRIQRAKGGGRRITFMPASDPSIASDGILINGAQTYGFDGIYKEWAPKGTTARKVLENHATEIIQFEVWMDGKRIRIPRRKHETMLMPDLRRAKAELSKDGKHLTVVVSGSDGAGSWSALWLIQRNGKVDLKVNTGG